jgi:hypothetical protein
LPFQLFFSLLRFAHPEQLVVPTEPGQMPDEAGTACRSRCPAPSARSIALHHEASRDPHRDASNFGVVTST